MKNNTLIFICLFLTVVILGVIYAVRNYNIDDLLNGTHKTDTVFSTKTDTLWKDTTIEKVKPIPTYIYKVKTDTVYDKDDNPIELVTENKVYNDTIVCEKDTAELRIFTSGIKSNVDSIFLRMRKSEIIKTNTITITKYIEKKKTFMDRIHIQPQVTSGFDLINKQWGLTVGVGVGLDI